MINKKIHNIKNGKINFCQITGRKDLKKVIDLGKQPLCDTLLSKKDILIYLNTPGGSVYAGLGIYDTMQYIQPDISTIVMGQAASMGSLLAQAGTKGKRFVLPKSRTMIHQPLGGASGQASDVLIRAKELERIKTELTEIYVKHNSKGKTFEDFELAMDRDNFMSSEEALEFGLADEIIEKRSDEGASKEGTT